MVDIFTMLAKMDYKHFTHILLLELFGQKLHMFRLSLVMCKATFKALCSSGV